MTVKKPDRQGERAGWTWGWLGGFLWIAIVAVVFLIQGQLLAGGSGLLFFLLAAWLTHRLAPWRHPTTPYWRLMMAEYALFLLSLPWAIWAFDGFDEFKALDRNAWFFLWLLPVFIPVFTTGRKTWADGERGAKERP